MSACTYALMLVSIAGEGHIYKDGIQRRAESQSPAHSKYTTMSSPLVEIAYETVDIYMDENKNLIKVIVPNAERQFVVNNASGGRSHYLVPPFPLFPLLFNIDSYRFSSPHDPQSHALFARFYLLAQ